jgi:hypothetical protein
MPKIAGKAALCAIAATAILVLSGCGENRSNLLPPDTAEQLDAKLDEVRSMVREGNCFEALATAEEVRTEVEALGSDVDSTLQRTLVDGVTQLQVTVQDNCVEADTDPAATPEPAPEPAPTDTPEPETGQGTTGDTGTTGTTGGGGGQTGGEPQPEPEPQPDPEPPPTPPDNGSGGVGPSTGGVAP